MAVQWRMSRWRGLGKVTRAQHWFWGHCGGDLEDGVNVVMVVKMVILGVVVMVVIVVVIKAGHCSCGRCGDGGGLGIGHGGQGGGRGHAVTSQYQTHYCSRNQRQNDDCPNVVRICHTIPIFYSFGTHKTAQALIVMYKICTVVLSTIMFYFQSSK